MGGAIPISYLYKLATIKGVQATGQTGSLGVATTPAPVIHIGKPPQTMPARDVQAFRPEDTPAEFLRAIERELTRPPAADQGEAMNTEAILENYGFTTEALLQLRAKLNTGDTLQRTGKDGTRVQITAGDFGFDWSYPTTTTQRTNG